MGIALRRASAIERVWVALVCIVLWIVSLPGIASAVDADPQPFDLLGNWYVLVHYRDSGAADPRADFWEDKIWTFELRGSRLVWTEYSVVSFRDDRGRTEALASGRLVRTPGRWQPSARQREEIDEGLGAVAQWARSKTLRGDAVAGYRSRGAANRESASVIGYSERWEIEGLTSEPLFRRADELSGSRAQALKGVTEYRATAVSVARLEGTFARDGQQQGSFVMRPTGPVRLVSGDDEAGR